MAEYYVSRQLRWGEGPAVEISVGGLEHSGPDMLCPRWPGLGEGVAYLDPREAVAAAIRVRDAWTADGDPPEEEIPIACGHSLGGLLHLDDSRDDAALVAWAEKTYEAAPKCDMCGDILPATPWRVIDAFDDALYCSEPCADKSTEQRQEEEGCHGQLPGNRAGVPAHAR